VENEICDIYFYAVMTWC